MNKHLPYYLGFSYCYGIGPMKFKLLLSHFGNVKAAYEAPKDMLIKLLGMKLTENFIDFRSKFDYENGIKQLGQKEIHVIVQEDASYPQSLRDIPDPPICLYVRGNVNLIKDSSTQFSHTRPSPSRATNDGPLESEKIAFDSSSNNKFLFFAIVGTRTPTPYGVQVTRKFAYELAEAGFIIVSGMAMGIDTLAHQAALEAKQKTIAILGCGVDIIYPAINTGLYFDIIKHGGLIISEFPPGHRVFPGLFISRNRLISGLSKGVLVVEGLRDSGSLITARYAAEQGKDVFAPPSPITSAMAAAPNLLIKQGAKLVTSIEDIIEEFGLKIAPKKKNDITRELSEEEKQIFDFLEPEARTVDEIVEEEQIEVNQVLNILSLMEIKGIIEKNNEGKYQIKLQ